MPPSYESLSTEEDSEEKFLVKSDHDFTSYNARKPSSKLTIFAYVLIALTIIFAGTNLATAITAIRVMHANNAAIDTLPRPNIFVGLPKNPQATRPGATVEHGHSHSHSDCKSFAK
ncbi:hypothetical protein CVT25_001573 [Psilocybe cyanescens]|uniref:Uncharacterized protein n=1 Tax=Psilocybe cyanescens TaxID=93625 RepID=A0A409WQ41_PSICY|nr:hypothetical protein CVT25_001573 [Psilocybe cyanescens]